ncbi:MAG: hypothetical protein L3J15_03830 [Devosiaceae bacterium]|nr:hypothetical protein [Devosiaceae bacterium]
MQKLSWILNIILIIIIGAMIYMFLIKGSTLKSEDGRTAIIINDAERNMMLGDMRKFLENVQIITVALGENDMEAIVVAAENVGLRDENPPPSLIAKLPLEFKTMGMDTHKAFDELAGLAKTDGDIQTVASALGNILINCTTCHAAYKIMLEEE